MKLSDLVNMPVGKFESETQACPTKHYNRGFNDAILKVSNLPVNETKLRALGWGEGAERRHTKR